MAITHELISSVTVGVGGASSIDFTNIPNTYTDLKLVTSLRTTDTGSNFNNQSLKFNSSTTSDYSSRTILVVSPNVYSYTSPTGTDLGYAVANGGLNIANTFNTVSYYIPNYASSSYKSISYDSTAEWNNTLGEMFMSAGLWSNTSAITSISITPAAATWAQYSTAYLYGIKKN